MYGLTVFVVLSAAYLSPVFLSRGVSVGSVLATAVCVGTAAVMVTPAVRRWRSNRRPPAG